MTQSLSVSPDTARFRDWLTISLLGLIHGSSHFFQLLIPTLFWYLSRDFGYDYVQLGFLVTCFFLVSAVGQASSGFVVDRVGPALVLYFGLGAFAVSAFLLAIAPNYAVLLGAAIIGGLGNSIFHPVDYSIINHQISASRLGHAYSVHGVSGYLGWAATPLFITYLSTLYSWRMALATAAVLMAALLVLAVWQRDLWGKAAASSTTQDLNKQSVFSILMTLLRKPTLWGAFLFFAFGTMALSAVQNYTIPLLSAVYGLSQVVAGSTLSSYMVAAAVGMTAGGFLAGATLKSERIVFLSLCTAALLMLLLAFGRLNASIAIVLVVCTGFFSGIAAPSRDMIIRRVTPKGSTGAVYGLVYSGMDAGASVAPLVFGVLVEAQYSLAPWFGAAFAFVMSALLAVWVAYEANKLSQTPA